MTTEDHPPQPDGVPPPPHGAADRPSWASSGLASNEEKNWDNEHKLKGQRQSNDLLWLKSYGLLVVVTTITFTLLFLASLVIWALHFLLPEANAWLSADQLSKIQSIIFSGSLGAIVSGVLQKQLSK